jgi:hypothetical protein
LFLMNSKFVVEQAQGLAGRVLDSEGLSDGQRVDFAYRIALNRSPTPDELSRVIRFVSEAGSTSSGKSAAKPAWEQFCQALLASGEFRYVE